MPIYEFVLYEVWGNETDGWDVNDVYRTGFTMEVTDKTTDDEIIAQIFDESALAKVEIDPHSLDHAIYLSVRETQRPLGELRPVSGG
jgi:hypothetical protein